MEIRNWLLISSKTNRVNFWDFKVPSEVRVVGNVYGREGFKDGTVVATASVTRFDHHCPTTIETETGSRYSLVDTNIDFAEALRIINEKEDIPIVINWYLHRQTKCKESPTDIKTFEDGLLDFNDAIQKISESETYEALILVGRDRSGKPISGEIVSQNGNFVTLKTMKLDSSDSPFEEVEKEVLVVWRNMDERVEHEIMFTGEYEGLDYDTDFEFAFNFKSRPNLSKILADL